MTQLAGPDLERFWGAQAMAGSPAMACAPSLLPLAAGHTVCREGLLALAPGRVV